MRSPVGRANGFTLVELLVVIAVIALLVGVLLPALSSARSAGMGSKSLSNMRQMATAWTVYAYDSRDIMVPSQPARRPNFEENLYDVGNGLHYRPKWFALIGAKSPEMFAYAVPSQRREDEHSYPVTNEIWLCPVVPDWVSSRNTAYGYNYQFLGNARFLGGPVGLSTSYVRFPVRISSIRTMSETVLFASSMGTAAGKPAAERTPNRTDGSRDPDLLALGGHGYALDPPRLPGDNDYADPQNPGPEHRSAPDPRYRGRANIVFCDGSARAMTLEELGYELAPDGRVLTEGEFATNRFFSGTGMDDDPPSFNPDR